MRDYIPVDIWKESYQAPSFTFVKKIPLSKIKINKKFFSWKNNVDPAKVDFITENFDLDFWMPIIVNPEYYLLDGQHRLRVAKKMGLKYIDVAISNEVEV